MSAEPVVPTSSLVSVRRASQKAEDAKQIESAVCDWIEELTAERKNGMDTHGWLRDGVVLCNLANTIRPGSVPTVVTDFGATDAMQNARKRENISKFRTAIQDMGVPTLANFDTNDLYEGKDLGRVMSCLHTLGIMLPDINPELADKGLTAKRPHGDFGVTAFTPPTRTAVHRVPEVPGTSVEGAHASESQQSQGRGQEGSSCQGQGSGTSSPALPLSSRSGVGAEVPMVATPCAAITAAPTLNEDDGHGRFNVVAEDEEEEEAETRQGLPLPTPQDNVSTQCSSPGEQPSPTKGEATSTALGGTKDDATTTSGAALGGAGAEQGQELPAAGGAEADAATLDEAKALEKERRRAARAERRAAELEAELAEERRRSRGGTSFDAASPADVDKMKIRLAELEAWRASGKFEPLAVPEEEEEGVFVFMECCAQKKPRGFSLFSCGWRPRP